MVGVRMVNEQQGQPEHQAQYQQANPCGRQGRPGWPGTCEKPGAPEVTQYCKWGLPTNGYFANVAEYQKGVCTVEVFRRAVIAPFFFEGAGGSGGKPILGVGD